MSDSHSLPSWQALLKAVAVAAVLASALDVAIQFWLTPLGWSPGMIIDLFAIGAIMGFIFASALALAIAVPLVRTLARSGHFEPVVLVFAGAVLGLLASILFSALGNTYQFMSGPAFWQSFVVNGVFGMLAGGLWGVFEKPNRPGDFSQSRA